MHELSLCYALLEQVERIAKQQQAERVVSIRLQIGPLAGIEPELLQRAFPLVIPGSLAAGAELVIEPLPLRIHCTTCEWEGEATPSHLRCPHCESLQTQVISGEEMLLASLELERVGE